MVLSSPPTLRPADWVARAWGVVVLLGALGCAGGGTPAGGSSSGGAGGNQRSGGQSGANGTGAGGSAADAKLVPDVAPDNDPAFSNTCEAAPVVRHAGAPVLGLAVEPLLGGRPLVLGETIMVRDRKIQLSTLRWFVSHVVLTRTGQPPVLGELVDDAGNPRPHGVQLIDFDDPKSFALRVRAPAGQYDEIALRFGLPPVCNTGNPAVQKFPLDADGGMAWTWSLGYILFRAEGNAVTNAGPMGLVAHGGVYPPDRAPPRFAAAGSLRLPSTGNRLKIKLDGVVGDIQGGDHLQEGLSMMNRMFGLGGVMELEVAR